MLAGMDSPVVTRASPPAWWPRLRGWVSQYKGVRALYDGDFYALTPLSLSDYDWIGFQFHRADLNRGVLQIFRRVHSALPSSEFPVFGLERSARYNVSCWDGMGLGADAMVMTGEQLRAGLVVALPVRGAAVIEYRAL